MTQNNTEPNPYQYKPYKNTQEKGQNHQYSQPNIP